MPFKRLLRRTVINRRLGLLWAGQVISQTGDSIFQIGLVWLLLEMTGSNSLTGLVASAAFLPILLFGLFAGVVADRFDRRRIMIVSDLARMLLVMLVPLLYYAGELTPLVLGVITFAVASFSAFFNPARDALVPELVAERDLPSANALIQTSWQIAILLGPAVAALLLARLGGSVIPLFWIDSATYFLSMLAIIWIGSSAALHPVKFADPVQAHGLQPVGDHGSDSPAPDLVETLDPVRSPDLETPDPRDAARGLERGSEGKSRSGNGRTSMFADMKEGLAWAVRNPVMRIILIVTAIDNVILMGPAIIGVPIFVREVLHRGPETYSWVQAALAGGAIAGAPFMATFGRRLPLGKTLMWGVVLDGLTYVPMVWVTTFEGAVAVIVCHSVFIPVITVTRTTLVQRHVPPHLRGRMFALIGMCVIGGTAISVVLTGIAAEVFPIGTIYLVIGLAAAATAIPGFFSKGLREADQTSTNALARAIPVGKPSGPER